MKKNLNPFLTEGYESPEYFCDREQETDDLLSALANGRNVTMYSTRRMGKSGLIKHAFHLAKESEGASCFYIDLFHTECLNDLVSKFSKAVMGALDGPVEAILRKAATVLRHVRPTAAFDPYTGAVTYSATIERGQEESSLEDIFNYLKNSDKTCYIAFDEFQQVMNYPENNVEALLRSHIQFIHNAHFVFSGSERHLMSEMFSSPARPFYASTQTMSLGAIDKEAYYKFASAFFSKSGRALSEECFSTIYDNSHGHTWYIQYWLNRLYEVAEGDATPSDVETALQKILREKDDDFSRLLLSISPGQRKVITAIAAEGAVPKPYDSSFTRKHALPADSTIRAALIRLQETGVLVQEREGYMLSDKFLMLSLKNLA